jgi:hypothetical protein
MRFRLFMRSRIVGTTIDPEVRFRDFLPLLRAYFRSDLTVMTIEGYAQVPESTSPETFRSVMELLYEFHAIIREVCDYAAEEDD